MAINLNGGSLNYIPNSKDGQRASTDKDPEGRKVKFVNDENHGTQSKRTKALKYLRDGETYTILSISVGVWRSTVKLREFPKQEFSTLLFDDA